MDKFAWGFGRKVQPVLEWTLKVFHDRANGTEAGLKGTMKKVLYGGVLGGHAELVELAGSSRPSWTTSTDVGGVEPALHLHRESSGSWSRITESGDGKEERSEEEGFSRGHPFLCGEWFRTIEDKLSLGDGFFSKRWVLVVGEKMLSGRWVCFSKN